MNMSARTLLETREAILKLMSDDEIAAVSTAEAAPSLVGGDEFIDLEKLDLGIQRAAMTGNVIAKHVLPRSAVSAVTWGRIANVLARS